MKAIYLDTFAGISGNMFLGALLDAGYPFEILAAELQKLQLGEYELIYQPANKLGIEAKYFNVLLPEEHHHEHTHEHEHSQEHHHEHKHEHRQNLDLEAMPVVKVSLENVHEYNGVDCKLNEEGWCTVHKAYHQGVQESHKHEHSLESIQEHNELACSFDAEGNCLVHEHHHEHSHEHHHEHGHEHNHEHHHEHSHEGALPHTHHHHEHRNLKAVMDIINNSDLSESIKLKAEKVFKAIAVAEGKVHGKPIEEVHFHEVGAIDTIIDIVGTLLGLEYLGIEKIYCGRINTGFGTVQCAHGLMPVPAPATAELLLGLPTEKGIVAKEMTTPTGAALVRVLAEIALQLPEKFVAEKIAYGAGTRECEIPNVLRMYIGHTEEQKQGLVEGACNIDDMTGEVLGYVLNKLMTSGLVKDAWAEAIYMKKNRPAYKLCFLAEERALQEIQALLFKETSTLGVRYYSVKRAELEREMLEVTIPEGKVRVKLGKLDNGEVKLAPEFEDCRKLAEVSGKSLRELLEVVMAEVKKNG